MAQSSVSIDTSELQAFPSQALKPFLTFSKLLVPGYYVQETVGDSSRESEWASTTESGIKLRRGKKEVYVVHSVRLFLENHTGAWGLSHVFFLKQSLKLVFQGDTCRDLDADGGPDAALG